MCEIIRGEMCEGQNVPLNLRGAKRSTPRSVKRDNNRSYYNYNCTFTKIIINYERKF